MGADDGQPDVGLPQRFGEIGHSGFRQQQRVNFGYLRHRHIDPVLHRLGMPQEGAVQGQVHTSRHGAQGVRFGTEVTTGLVRTTPRRIEISQ